MDLLPMHDFIFPCTGQFENLSYAGLSNVDTSH